MLAANPDIAKAQAFAAHPGLNPRHVMGGYSRKITIPDPLDIKASLKEHRPARTIKVIGLPRNPGRWIGHTRLADGSVLKSSHPPLEIYTRQQRRALERQDRKADRRRGKIMDRFLKPTAPANAKRNARPPEAPSAIVDGLNVSAKTVTPDITGAANSNLFKRLAKKIGF